MTLDADVPNPPSLDRPQDPDPTTYEAVEPEDEPVGDDYRRDELAAALEAGAWADAFEEWRGTTYLSATEYRTALERGLIDGIDLYWNRAAEDVGYRVPEVSDDAAVDPDAAQSIREELDSLARIVTERLEEDYLHRDGDEFGFFSEE